MRVIAGQCKGRRLLGPKSEAIRPALDQVKEAVFNILFDVSDVKVLDLFAGTGSVGIEALSRGARYCTFVDNLPEAQKLIGRNLSLCGLADRAQVLSLSVGKAIGILEEKGVVFDLIFCDPPYQKRQIKRTLQQLESSAIVTVKTRVVVEHHPKEPVPEMTGLILTDQRNYGQTVVSFLKKSQ